MSELVFDVASDSAEAARRAASFICDTLAEPGAVGALCLAGGGTPRPMYELLAGEPFSARMPWPRLHWFLGDERFVPPDDHRSNYRMITEALFSRAPIPADHVHAVPTTGVSLDEAADLYQAELQTFYGSKELRRDKPLFDVVILGLGPDGHTASLLPGQPEQNERVRWVRTATSGAPEPRITLTPPALEAAHAVIFLVAGAEKRQALARLRAGDVTIPAAHIRPHGKFVAFVDAAAAG
jgi:6-phosphogluconolactonase